MTQGIEHAAEKEMDTIETHAIISELQQFMNEIPDIIEEKEVSCFDEKQQFLMLDAIDIVLPVIESSEGTHSLDYYRALFVTGMPGLEKLDFEAQQIATKIALEKVRKEIGYEKPSLIPMSASISRDVEESGHDENDNSTNETEHIDDASDDLNAGDKDSQSGVYDSSGADSSNDVKLEKEMHVIGIAEHCFVGKLFDNDEFLLSAYEFGNGQEVVLVETDVSVCEDPNYLHVELIVAADSWGEREDLIRVSISEYDKNSLLQEATNAFNYMVKHVLDYGDAIVMDSKIRRVIGVKGMENPEKQAAIAAKEENEKLIAKVMEEAKELGFTDGDVMGAFFRVGKDWTKVIDFLKAVYSHDNASDDEASKAK